MTRNALVWVLCFVAAAVLGAVVGKWLGYRVLFY